MVQITEHIYCFRDTCNVYVIKNEKEALLIDFGSGDVLDCLCTIGVQYVTGILLTHHHRDQAQGLTRAVVMGIPVWVPHMEQDLFEHVNEHWQGREIYNNYNVRQDRFSLLESVQITGTLKDYSSFKFDILKITVIPTPGHTVGSITLILQIDGLKLAFTGDLIYAPGKVWTMSAIQWSYNGAEGAAMSTLSLLDLKDRCTDVLLPSHGEPMWQPVQAIELLVDCFQRLRMLRNIDTDLLQLREQPYVQITPHLLMNRTSISNSYVLLSDSGKALLIDYGYDFRTGTHVVGTDRSCWRSWLYNIGALKKQYNVSHIDVVIPTHYHDDHVAGLNLLREVEGTQVWAGENFADILEQPSRYNVPCLWFDPIPVTRRLPLNRPFTWEEFEFTLYEQGGHTLYATAISFKVDEKRVLAIGDQYFNDAVPNHVYSNRYRIEDYKKSGELYLNIHPDLILAGHSAPLWVKAGYLEQLKAKGEMLDQLHTELLPTEKVNLGVEGFCARIYPYQLSVRRGEEISLEVEVDNPLKWEEEMELQLILPAGWSVEESIMRIKLAPQAAGTVAFIFRIPCKIAERRVRVAVDVTAGEIRLGQQAEALVTVI